MNVHKLIFGHTIVESVLLSYWSWIHGWYNKCTRLNKGLAPSTRQASNVTLTLKFYLLFNFKFPNNILLWRVRNPINWSTDFNSGRQNKISPQFFFHVLISVYMIKYIKWNYILLIKQIHSVIRERRLYFIIFFSFLPYIQIILNKEWLLLFPMRFENI